MSFSDYLGDDIRCVLKESLQAAWDFMTDLAAAIVLVAALFGFPVWLTFREIAIGDTIRSAIKVAIMRRK